MRIGFLLTILCFIALQINAQNATQTVKGQIIDQQSEIPIIGATVLWLNSEEIVGTTTDLDGYFYLNNIPVGRQAFQISYLGYESITLPNVEVTSGKEAVFNVKMVESIEVLNEVVISGKVAKDKSINEMATISARTFSLEEVNRYAGGRSDVARLAGNFAGVATADDSRNDIVIRGNSPTGVLWRLEGIPIPNPNHFSTLGSTGGPVSAINPNVLKNSDFLTSAFPSEYGNANSGVFDLGLRSGNRDSHEFTFQMAAFSGLEGMAEGPLGKKGGSYLVSIRNSFIAIIAPPQTAAIPNYSDISFKLESANGKFGKFSLFGIGGQSSIDFIGSEITSDDLFSEKDQDLFPRSNFGVVGLRHNKIIGNDSYLRTIISTSLSQTEITLDRYYNFGLEDETKVRYGEVNDNENRISVSSFYNKKFNPKTSMRIGGLFEYQKFDLFNKGTEGNPDLDNDGFPDLGITYEFNDGVSILQPFAQVRHKFNKKWSTSIGVHGFHHGLSNQFVLEPRASLVWNFKPSQKITLGYGLHSQAQPLSILLAESTDNIIQQTQSNIDLEFTKSQHFVLGYDNAFAKNWRTKVELYRQVITNVPVDPFLSSFSLINLGGDFGFERGKVNLINEGTGYNQGVEITIEKFFSKGYHGLFTASIFDSKYKGSDGIERNSAFNNRYVLNLLAGKEWKIGKDKQHAILFDTKVTTAGGRYYTPVDLEASIEAGYEIRQDEFAYSEQYQSYFRWDLKLGIKLNSKKRKFSQQLFLDFQNVTNRQNIFSREYNRSNNQVNERFQSGFFPDFLYRIQF